MGWTQPTRPFPLKEGVGSHCRTSQRERRTTLKPPSPVEGLLSVFNTPLTLVVIPTFAFLASTIHVFYSTECPSSGLFAGAATEAATCPQVFTGGVRTSSSNGIACYSGLTANSIAVFMCGVDGANCTGSCEAVCVCSVGGTEGEWSASFEDLECSFANSPGKQVMHVFSGVLVSTLYCV